MCACALSNCKVNKKIKKLKIPPLFNPRALLGLFLFCAVAFGVVGAAPESFALACSFLYGAQTHGSSAFWTLGSIIFFCLFLHCREARLCHFFGKSAFVFEIPKAFVDLSREQLLHAFAQNHNHTCRVNGIVCAQQCGEPGIFGKEIFADFCQIILSKGGRIVKLVVTHLRIALVIGMPH